jgi:hypothetical protein
MDKSPTSVPELAEWLSLRQSQLRISKTTVTPGGQTLDWIPIESQIAGPIAAPPPSPARKVPSANPKTVATALRFDIGERGPAGHVPVLRPDISQFKDSATLRDVLSKRGGLRVNIHRSNRRETDPNPAGYFHATSAEWATVYGGDARLSIWDPKIDIPSSPGDDHSISQTWLQNYQTGQIHSIEAGWTVDQSLNGDRNPHLFTFFTNNSYGPSGDNVGGYNRLVKGWVQFDATIYNRTQVPALSEQLVAGCQFKRRRSLDLGGVLPRKPLQERSRRPRRVDQLRW